MGQLGQTTNIGLSDCIHTSIPLHLGIKAGASHKLGQTTNSGLSDCIHASIPLHLGVKAGASHKLGQTTNSGLSDCIHASIPLHLGVKAGANRKLGQTTNSGLSDCIHASIPLHLGVKAGASHKLGQTTNMDACAIDMVGRSHRIDASTRHQKAKPKENRTQHQTTTLTSAELDESKEIFLFAIELESVVLILYDDTPRSTTSPLAGSIFIFVACGIFWAGF